MIPHSLKRGDADRMCGSEPTMEAVEEMENVFASILAQGTGTDTPSASFTVPVIFNVITAGNDGNIPCVTWFSFLPPLPYSTISEIPRSLNRSMS